MKIAFFGTPEYVLPILKSLRKKKSFDIVATVTQNPKPVGRKKLLTPSPVEVWANENKVPVFYSSADFLKSKIKADLGILAALHERLPKKMLEYFPHGILNIHLSLLPKYRSSSCVQAAIISGDKYSGATIIKLDEQLDHGPIVFQFKEKILKDDAASSLRERLFVKSAKIMPKIIEDYVNGKIKLRKQDHKKATYANMLKKEDAFIPHEFLNACLQGRSLQAEWKIPFIKDYTLHPDPCSLVRFIRAMQPWPQAWTTVQLEQSTKYKEQRQLKILKAHVEKRINESTNQRITILILDSVQLESKNPTSWKQFKEGYPDAVFANPKM